MIPPAELDAALVEVARLNFGGSPDELAQEAARLLGLKSVGAQLREASKARVIAFEGDGRLVRAGDLLVAPAGDGPLPGAGPSGAGATLH